MSSQQGRDVVIIGAGVVGCSIALALSRAGFRTLNVDTLPAAGYGSTSHSSAIVRPFYSHVTSAAVAHESRFRWLRWQEFLGHTDPRGMAGYTECGGLVLMREGDEASYDGNLRVLEAIGADYRILNASGLEALYPGICLDGFGPPRPRSDPEFGQPTDGRIAGGIFLPQAGYVSDPQLAAHNLESAARALGAEFRFGQRVKEIVVEGQAVMAIRLESRKGTGTLIDAPLLLNAAGPHSSQINALAGIGDSLPIRTRAERHEVAYLPAPSGYLKGGNGFLIDLDTGVYQRPDGADLLIGTADPDCDPPDLADPDDFNAGFTEQWTTQVYRTAQRFPALSIENTARGTVGLYDVSTDWIPIYDKTDIGGYFLAIGTSGNQFKNAPLIGDLLSSIIQAEGEGRDHDLDPATLALEQVGMTVDVSFYSRNRTVHETRSVLA